MTLLQGDRCCGCLRSWGLEKTEKEYSPQDFHGPREHRAAPAAMGYHGAENSKAETPSVPGCRAILGNVCSSPWWEGTALSSPLCTKLLGLSFPHWYLQQMAKLKIGKGDVENTEVITLTQKTWNFYLLPGLCWQGCSPLSAIPQVSLGHSSPGGFRSPSSHSSVPRVGLMAEAAQSQM